MRLRLALLWVIPLSTLLICWHHAGLFAWPLAGAVSYVSLLALSERLHAAEAGTFARARRRDRSCTRDGHWLGYHACGLLLTLALWPLALLALAPDRCRMSRRVSHG